jgi:hypothetical protein
MIRIAAILLALVCASISHAAVTYDNDAEGIDESVSTLTLTSFTVANNANRYLIVAVAMHNATVSSVTFNGSGAGWSQLGTSLNATGSERVSLWGKAAPDVATGNIVVTLSGSSSFIGVNALSVYNVDQGTPTGTVAAANGLTTAVSVAASAAVGDLVFDGVCYWVSGGGTGTPEATQTERADMNNGSFAIFASTEPGAAPTVTMSWTGSGASPEWAQAAVAIKAAAAAGSETGFFRRRL